MLRGWLPVVTLHCDDAGRRVDFATLPSPLSVAYSARAVGRQHEVARASCRRRGSSSPRTSSRSMRAMSCVPITATYAVCESGLTAMPRGYGPSGMRLTSLAVVGVDDAQVVAAPVGDEHVPAVRRDRDVLRHHADLDDLVDRERLQVDAVHVARSVAGAAGSRRSPRGRSPRRTSSSSTTYTCVPSGVNAASTGAPCEMPGMTGDAELRRGRRVSGIVFTRCPLAVVHRHRVAVHHVLREHEAAPGRDDRLGRDVAGDGPGQRHRAGRRRDRQGGRRRGGRGGRGCSTDRRRSRSPRRAVVRPAGAEPRERRPSSRERQHEGHARSARHAWTSARSWHPGGADGLADGRRP